MATYSKETALYDTGAISSGISDASKTASNYLTDISGGGVMVHPNGDSTSGWSIASAIQLLKSGVSYIWAGLMNNIATVRVGKEAGGHTIIDENGMRIYGDSTGSTQIANLGYGSGTDSGGGTSDAPYYTLGVRESNSAIGNYSVVEGSGSTASGYSSHAEGFVSYAIGAYSHAEGGGASAQGVISHAEGGGSVAIGMGSHAEGSGSHANGIASHAQNYNTVASSDYQTALGKYNEEDANDTYAVIIGNGTDKNHRSNALAVDWDGDVQLALDTTSASGTDHDLYTAINTLGWNSDVIV